MRNAIMNIFKAKCSLFAVSELLWGRNNLIFTFAPKGLKLLSWPFFIGFLFSGPVLGQGFSVGYSDKGSTSSTNSCSELSPSSYRQVYSNSAQRYMNVPIEYTYYCNYSSKFTNHSGKLESTTKCLTHYRRKYDDFSKEWVDQVVVQDCDTDKLTSGKLLKLPNDWHPPMALEQ